MISIYAIQDIWDVMVGGQHLLEVIYKNAKTYCRAQVEKTYILSLIFDSDWLVVATSRETVRGFAFLKKVNVQTLYLHLICAALAHPMQRRSALKDNVGGDMILRIQRFSTQRGFKRLQLHALAPVITLYHKFGWRFVDCVNQREKPAITSAVGALAAEVVSLRKGQLSPDKIDAAVVSFIYASNKDIHSSWWCLRDLLERNDFSAMTNACGDTIRTQVRRAQAGETSIDYSAGMNLREALLSQDAAEALGISSTRELVKVDPQIAGYTMLWCPEWKK
jgi:hypothetical protein